MSGGQGGQEGGRLSLEGMDMGDLGGEAMGLDIVGWAKGSGEGQAKGMIELGSRGRVVNKKSGADLVLNDEREKREGK